MGTKGFDVFFSEPSDVSEMTCRVCGAKCEVRRGVNGPTSMAEGTAGRSVLHDYHYCPRSQEPWHDEALKLAQAIKQSPSPSLRGVMRRDLDEILAKNPPSSPDDVR